MIIEARWWGKVCGGEFVCSVEPVVALSPL